MGLSTSPLSIAIAASGGILNAKIRRKSSDRPDGGDQLITRLLASFSTFTLICLGLASALFAS
jgi:hypothetical protein